MLIQLSFIRSITFAQSELLSFTNARSPLTFWKRITLFFVTQRHLMVAQNRPQNPTFPPHNDNFQIFYFGQYWQSLAILTLNNSRVNTLTVRVKSWLNRKSALEFIRRPALKISRKNDPDEEHHNFPMCKTNVSIRRCATIFFVHAGCTSSLLYAVKGFRKVDYRHRFRLD